MECAEVLILLLSLACASDGIQERKAGIRLESLTPEAFAGIEPKLRSLGPGPVEVPYFSGNMVEFKVAGERRDFVVVSPGLVLPLSGGFAGYLGFGELKAVLSDRVLGEYVFGYLQEGTGVLVPRFVVTFRGARLAENEYDANDPAHRRTRLYDDWVYSHDYELTSVRELNLAMPEPRVPAEGETRVEVDVRDSASTLLTYVRRFLSRDAFERVSRQLGKLPAGSDKWDVIEALGGEYQTWDRGESYTLLMDGYLIWREEGLRWSTITEQGLLKVWPFGYLDGDTQVPVLDVVFVNGSVVTVRPHAAREDVIAWVREAQRRP